MPKIPYKNLAIVFFFLAIAFFATRIYKLGTIPVFVDEAIYVRWAQVMKSEPTLRFLPQSDGKQPLFMWINMPVFKLIKDPLIAGRAVSIGAGFLAISGLYLLAFYLTSSIGIASMAVILYVFAPFTFFFDRMALVDSLLSATGIWAILLGLLFVKTKRTDVAIFLGFALGFAFLTKSPAQIMLILQPLLLLTLDKKPSRKDLLQLGFGYFLVIVISQAMYNILRLGPNFNMIGARNGDYLFTFKEVLTHPLNPLVGNMKDTFAWTQNLVSPLVILFALASLLKPSRKTFVLWCFVLLPMLAQASIAKVYTSRYFLYTIPVLLLLAADGFFILKTRIHIYIAMLLFTIFLGYSGWYLKNLYLDPQKAPLPQNMAHGYLQEWTAGWGQKEISDYIKDKAKDHKVIVATEGYFGTLPDGLQIYTEKNPNLTVIGVGLPIKGVPQQLTNSLKDAEAYLVVNASRDQMSPAEQTRVELINSFTKPARPDGTNEVLHFYRVKF
jgi:4-amino-4-deoxy-L-arabinose transferase-like glycosyltransferase